jgi:hypothetical protein
MRLLAALALGLLIASTTSAAAAEETPETPTLDDPTWYGWQTLLADGAAAALVAGGLASGRSVVTAAGVASFALTPGVIHGVHGHPGKAAGDIAVRIGSPIVCAVVLGLAGALLGRTTAPSHYGPADDVSPSGAETGLTLGGLIGLGVGVVAASAIDAGMLARSP